MEPKTKKIIKTVLAMAVLYLPVFVVVGIVLSPLTLLLNRYGGNLAREIFSLGILILALAFDYPAARWFTGHFTKKGKFYAMIILLFLVSTAILTSIILIYVFTQEVINLNLQ